MCSLLILTIASSEAFLDSYMSMFILNTEDTLEAQKELFINKHDDDCNTKYIELEARYNDLVDKYHKLLHQKYKYESNRSNLPKPYIIGDQPCSN